MEDLEILCLDTDILIDFLRGETKTTKEVKKLEDLFELTTTAINLFELYYGVYKTGRDRNVNAIRELENRLEVLKFTSTSAKISGEILSKLEKKGEAIDFRDVMIASIGIENDVALYTRNVKHFERVEGLKLYEFHEF
ncbi:MAG: PIN domain nuclease [Candidatus Hydrothermarchaeota archaeon]|nr:MAG: PIN domain nuclease [Candidatus Hydrothermarchaeota archaeon]